MEIDYKLENAGWAIVKISDGYREVVLSPSYLHDSLKNLAESALKLKTKGEQTVIFMDEPGEHWLVLKKLNENTITYQLRWYEHWASKNMVAEDDYEIVITGTTTLTKYINQVRKNLINIYEECGPDVYKEKWIMHDFPMCEYERLK